MRVYMICVGARAMRKGMMGALAGEEQEQEVYKEDTKMLDIESRLQVSSGHYHQKDPNHAEVREAKRAAAGPPRPFKNVRGATRPDVGRSVM